MGDIKWIKITTDMFDNRKIRAIRKLPEGNNIILIWVMLLSLAGRCNASGMIFLTANIPYTNKMLADELNFEESVICMALDALERFGMITRDENMLISINNWVEYQNVEGMDRIREQNRLRNIEYRKRKKLIEKSGTDLAQDDMPSSSYSPVKSNLSNLEYILNAYVVEYDVITDNPELLNTVREWMDYKDHKKPKSSNHYDTERGMRSFLKKVSESCIKYGAQAVIEVIEEAMGNNYQGVTWDKLCNRQNKKNAGISVYDEWRNA